MGDELRGNCDRTAKSMVYCTYFGDEVRVIAEDADDDFMDRIVLVTASEPVLRSGRYIQCMTTATAAEEVRKLCRECGVSFYENRVRGFDADPEPEVKPKVEAKRKQRGSPKKGRLPRGKREKAESVPEPVKSQDNAVKDGRKKGRFYLVEGHWTFRFDRESREEAMRNVRFVSP